ncbi:uncharacterized protein [Coffea arabica]|uniref:Uncharacterized protein isoform X1 n=1 Tax=Coffea arabica TaxID=13443 RepID=A0A6P6T528_COFAR|nr:UBP1-associated proteins 1C-like isoform X1 [Coffea arabica]
MVWFQCDDCGDNLKKPKLPNHFRTCSASKLSCIDCGEIFGRQNVESHTQCVTEAEKYGPKGQGKAINGSNNKPNGASKQKPDIDIHVGLSQRAPWSCSLCNTNVTSQQTLLLHAEGKKHIAKAKAFHAAKQPKQSEGNLLESDVPAENNAKNEAVEATEEEKEQKPSNTIAAKKDNSVAENDNLQLSKKRKLKVSENVDARQIPVVDMPDESGNGEIIHVRETKMKKLKEKDKKDEEVVSEDKKSVNPSPKNEDDKKKIKWKKLITSSLKSNPDGSLKFKKLIKLVLKSLKESGSIVEESRVAEILQQKINSSSRFDIDGKYVRLAVKS